MRITGYPTEHGVLGLVSPCSHFIIGILLSSYLPFCSAYCVLLSLGWYRSPPWAWGVFTGSFRSHTPKGLL